MPRGSGTEGKAGPEAILEAPPPSPMNPVRGETRLLEPPFRTRKHSPPTLLLEASGPGFAQASLHTHMHAGPLLAVPVPKRLGIACRDQGPQGTGRTSCRSSAERIERGTRKYLFLLHIL